MASSPPTTAAACSGAATNWRKEADERLRRFHSLLFGADAALERGDAAAAQALALRLLGFLDSQALAADAGSDAAFIAPLRAAASARLAAASRARAPDSDRYRTLTRLKPSPLSRPYCVVLRVPWFVLLSFRMRRSRIRRIYIGCIS
jgi:hypothetical protein